MRDYLKRSRQEGDSSFYYGERGDQWREGRKEKEQTGKKAFTIIGKKEKNHQKKGRGDPVFFILRGGGKNRTLKKSEGGVPGGSRGKRGKHK